MSSRFNDLPAPPVLVTVQVAPEERGAFMQLVADFQAGKFRVSTPAIDFQGKDYGDAVRDVVGDSATSESLRKRIVEDHGRDAPCTLTDAEMLHALQAKRFGEAVPIGETHAPGAGGVEEVGVAALRRLYQVAQGESGQCRHIARFLLGLYNGARFPFDLTDLRGIDDALYEDCLRVLNMDARSTKREVHAYFEDGGRKWEQMARDWRVVDMLALRQAAKRLAEQVGFSGPHAGAAAELFELVKGKRD